LFGSISACIFFFVVQLFFTLSHQSKPEHSRTALSSDRTAAFFPFFQHSHSIPAPGTTYLDTFLLIRTDFDLFFCETVLVLHLPEPLCICDRPLARALFLLTPSKSHTTPESVLPHKLPFSFFNDHFSTHTFPFTRPFRRSTLVSSLYFCLVRPSFYDMEAPPHAEAPHRYLLFFLSTPSSFCFIFILISPPEGPRPPSAPRAHTAALICLYFSFFLFFSPYPPVLLSHVPFAPTNLVFTLGPASSSAPFLISFFLSPVAYFPRAARLSHPSPRLSMASFLLHCTIPSHPFFAGPPFSRLRAPYSLRLSIHIAPAFCFSLFFPFIPLFPSLFILFCPPLFCSPFSASDFCLTAFSLPSSPLPALLPLVFPSSPEFYIELCIYTLILFCPRALTSV